LQVQVFGAQAHWPLVVVQVHTILWLVLVGVVEICWLPSEDGWMIEVSLEMES